MARWLGLSLIGILAGSLAVSGCKGADGEKGADGSKGADGQTGTKGDKGDPGNGTPSVSAILPTLAFQGRTIDVIVSGNGTNWDAKTTVDFGDKIKVNEVIAASATALHVNITIDKDAKTDYRDVTVKDAAGTETYKGAFEIQPPLEVVQTVGTSAQGSRFEVLAKNHDLENPFDLTQDPLTGAYTNLNVDVPKGFTALLVTASDYSVQYRLYSDVMSPTGDVAVGIKSGPSGSETDFTSTPVKIDMRSAKTLMAGVADMEMLKNPLESVLYQYTPSAGVVIDYAVTTPSMSAAPEITTLPKSGSWADASFAFGPAGSMISKSTDPFYLLLTDRSKAVMVPTSLTIKETPFNPASDMEPNDSKATASVAKPLAIVDPASMSSATDVDWYKVTVSAADIAAGNTKIQVNTTYDPKNVADIALEVFSTDGTTSLTGGPVDNGIGEDAISSDVPGPGDYYVVVSNGMAGGGYSAMYPNYSLKISLVP